jgi:predicted ATP-dependent serine protease
MAVEQARICGACGRESPSWADRCPVCGSISLIHQITIVPAPQIATISPKAGRKKARRAMVGREPPHTTPARSTA